MVHSRIARRALGCLLALFAAAAAVASPPGQSDASNPVGTWLLDVSFPQQFNNPELNFKELLTLHAGGTLTETNASLNAASGVLGVPLGLGLVGSDGQGTWRRSQTGQIEVSFRKMVFCGTAAVGLCTNFGRSPGDLLGYLVVRLTATVKGDTLNVPLGGDTQLLVVTPTGQIPIPFGEASATGTRLR